MKHEAELNGLSRQVPSEPSEDVADEPVTISGFEIEILDAQEEESADMVLSTDEFLRSETWQNAPGALPILLGKGVDGVTVVLDLARVLHLLIAGATGSGKSVFMNLCLFSLMLRHTPEELKLVLVDTKACEFNKYEDLPYLQFPVITNIQDTLKVLQWLNKEMTRRHELLTEAKCSDILTLNAQKPNSMPYIVLFIDELADIMLDAGALMENHFTSLCAKGPAVGIHLVISTQRPDSMVLTDCVKANFPTRIAFQVAGPQDSLEILNKLGAEKLLGRGDMLYLRHDRITRHQGGFLEHEEIDRLLNDIRNAYGTAKFQQSLPELPAEK